MDSIAVGIVCKTPSPGLSKTRLSPPLSADEAAALSACFIRDAAAIVSEVIADGVTPYAIYTPAGSEAGLRTLLLAGFRLLAQRNGDLGARMAAALRELLAMHPGAILIGADSPTFPVSILRAAVDAVRRGGSVVLCPALDGGYMLIGLSALHERLFADIPWSTGTVYERTLERATEIGVPVIALPGWYDVDDAASFAMLKAELAGERPAFAQPGLVGAPASATRAYFEAQNRVIARPFNI